MGLIGRLGNSTISAWYNHVFFDSIIYINTEIQTVIFFSDLRIFFMRIYHVKYLEHSFNLEQPLILNYKL
jgi:hypothetical protein